MTVKELKEMLENIPDNFRVELEVLGPDYTPIYDTATDIDMTSDSFVLVGTKND